MVKVSEHFIKRLEALTDPVRRNKERHFIETYLLSGIYAIRWNKGIQVKDISLFASRCRDYECRMVGLEVHPDSPFPLFCFVHEEYNSEFRFDWFIPAIQALNNNNVLDMIMPTVYFPDKLVESYLL